MLADVAPTILHDKDVGKQVMTSRSSDATAKFATSQTGWALEFTTEEEKRDRNVILKAI